MLVQPVASIDLNSCLVGTPSQLQLMYFWLIAQYWWSNNYAANIENVSMFAMEQQITDNDDESRATF